MNAYNVNVKLDDINDNIERRVLLPNGISFEKMHEIICILFNFNEYNKYEFLFDDINLAIYNTGSLNRDHIDSRYELIDEYFKAFASVKYVNSFWNVSLTVSDSEYDKKFPKIINIEGKYNPSQEIECVEDFSNLLESNKDENSGDYLLKEVKLLNIQERLMRLFNILYTIENNRIILLKEEGTLNNYIKY